MERWRWSKKAYTASYVFAGWVLSLHLDLVRCSKVESGGGKRGCGCGQWKVMCSPDSLGWLQSGHAELSARLICVSHERPVCG